MQRVLLLSHVRPGHANTSFEHEAALANHEGIEALVISPLDFRFLPAEIRQFDALIIHYSIISFSLDYLSKETRDAIRAFRGLKAIFIQDEYRFVNDAVDAMLDLGVDVLFTCVPEPAVPVLYGRLRQRGVRIEQTLTGYVPDELIGRDKRPLRERPLDMVYRSRPLPAILGALGFEKVQIAKGIQELAPRYDLKVDVDWREEARIYGEGWNAFMASGKAALGTESGASICDLTGDLDAAMTWYLARNPTAGYPEAYRDFLHPFEGNAVINAISPRAFEAIALGTALVQFPGSYSGILQTDEHYIVLEKDFSNLGDVSERLRDIDGLEKMATRAYDDIVRSRTYSYEAFAEQAYAILREEWETRIHRPPVPLPSLPGWPRAATPSTEGDGSHADWRAAMVAPFARTVNLALANMGASLSSTIAFFARPHDADYLLREGTSDGYAAALPDQALPQSLMLDLGRAAAIHSIEIDWFSEENRPAALSIKIADADQDFSIIFDGDQVPVETRLQLGGRTTRWVQITVHAFHGQGRLLVKGLRVFEASSQLADFGVASLNSVGRRP